MSTSESLILVTGATGKVGQNFIQALLAEPRFAHFRVRAFCHNRSIPESPRVEAVKGNMAERRDVQAAMQDGTHVLHLATCKETHDAVMDVTVKGLFWLLEACRTSAVFQRFILIGGDAAMGHFFYPHPLPVTETQPHSAYPGCYALSKVLEETMLQQYYIQYDFDGCCLRAPWIMEADDFKYSLTFGRDVFGGPRWHELVTPEEAERYVETSTVPVMLDPNGEPVQRNFVHVSDLVQAILTAIDHPKARQETFNICMDEPIQYRRVADYLHETRGLPSVDIRTRFQSTWLDNNKAKFLLGWQPEYDMRRLVDEAWDYQRSEDNPRIVWYPG